MIACEKCGREFPDGARVTSDPRYASFLGYLGYHLCAASSVPWDGEHPVSPNPKQAFGDKKPNLALVPPVSVAYEALAFEQGAAKYGPYNWRDKAVEAMTYIASSIRHIHAWLDGEEFSSDTANTDRPVHNLAAAKAGLGILIDCIEQGTLVDNRPPRGAASAMHDRVRAQREAPAEGP